MYSDILVLVWAVVAPALLQFTAQPLLSSVFASNEAAIRSNPKVVALLPAINIAVGSTASYLVVGFADWVVQPPGVADTLRGVATAALAALVASFALAFFALPTLWVARDTRWKRQARAVAVAFFVAAPIWAGIMIAVLRLIIPFAGSASLQVAQSFNAIVSTLLVQLAIFLSIRNDWLGHPPEDSPRQGD